MDRVGIRIRVSILGLEVQEGSLMAHGVALRVLVRTDLRLQYQEAYFVF